MGKCFFLGIKLLTSDWVQATKTWLLHNLFFFLFLSLYFSSQNMKKDISTSVWKAQHPKCFSKYNNILLMKPINLYL